MLESLGVEVLEAGGAEELLRLQSQDRHRRDGQDSKTGVGDEGDILLFAPFLRMLSSPPPGFIQLPLQLIDLLCGCIRFLPNPQQQHG